MARKKVVEPDTTLPDKVIPAGDSLVLYVSGKNLLEVTKTLSKEEKKNVFAAFKIKIDKKMETWRFDIFRQEKMNG